MLTELRRHLETEKREGQLPIINESVYYRVTYSEGGIGMGGGGEEMIWKNLAFAAAFCTAKGPLGQFYS